MTHYYNRLRINIILFISLICPSALAQSSYSTDTAYVSAMLRKGEAIETQNLKKAIEYYEKGHATAKTVAFTKGYFEAVRLLTFAYNGAGRHEEAKQLALEALARVESDTAKRYRMIVHAALAMTASKQGDMKEAIRQYEQAATYVRLLGRRDNEAVIYNNMGVICERQHLYDQAIVYYKKSLSIVQKLPNSTYDIAGTLFNMGTVYSDQEKVGPSIAYTLRAIGMLDPTRDFNRLIPMYNNLGITYRNINKFDSCFYYLNKALLLARQSGNSSEKFHLLITIAGAYTSQRNAKKSRLYVDRATAMLDSVKPSLPLQQALLVETVNMWELLGDYKKAYHYLETYVNNKDSLTSESIREQVTVYEERMRQAEARQKIADKQAQITGLEADQRRQTMWLWIAGITVLALLAGGILGWLYYRQRQKTAATALLAAQQEQELATIRAELTGQQKERTRISKEMHDDLGASMTAIGLLSEVAKTRVDVAAVPEVGKISEISASMITSMNEIIWSMNTRNDSLNGLIAYIRAYAREFIDNTSLGLKIDIDESPNEVTIRGSDRRNVFLTVKEALNNAVKHAQATQITLQIKPVTEQTKGTLRIDVCDNGQGFDPDSLAHVHRNGLTNMQLRMQESGGTCAVSPTGQGTCVVLHFPY